MQLREAINAAIAAGCTEEDIKKAAAKYIAKSGHTLDSGLEGILERAGDGLG